MVVVLPTGWTSQDCVRVTVVIMVLSLLATSGVSTACECDTKSCSVVGELSLSAEVFESGTNLTATCRILQQPPDRPCYFGAHDLFFRFLNDDVDDAYVSIVNSTTALLRLPGLRREHSGKHLYCKLRGYVMRTRSGRAIRANIGQKVVTVADAPVKPNITQCKVYNWSSMECWWEPTNQNAGINTTTTVYWTVLPSHGYFPCPRLQSNRCQWPSSAQAHEDSYKRDHDYHLNVTVSNLLGTVSTSVSVETKYKVMPNPVDPIRIVEDNSSTSITLQWESPTRHASLYQIIYNMNITSQWGDTEQYNTTANKETVTYRLEGLVPHTRYTIVMRCIPSYNHTGVGFWSNETTRKAQTEAAVPNSLPLVTPGGYLLNRDASTDHHGNRQVEVDIFWQPLPENETYGSEVTTRLRAYAVAEGYVNSLCSNASRAPAAETNVSGLHAYTASLRLDTASPAYQLCVRQGNEMGYSDTPEPQPLLVHVGDNDLPGTTFHVEGEDNILYVKWSAVDQAAGYTVFWCKGFMSFLRCDEKSVLQWMEAGTNDSSTQIVLPPSEQYTQYIVAMSTEYHGPQNSTVSSGMAFAYCVFSRKNPLKSPTDLKVSSKQSLEGKSLTVEWTKPDWKSTAYIHSFLVSYCSKRRCSQPENMAVPVVRKLDGTRQIYTINGLENGESYVVRVMSIGDHGNQSPFTASVRGIVAGKEWTATQKALLTVGCIIGVMLLVPTLYFIVWTCKKKFSKAPFKVVIPEIQVLDRHEVCMPPEQYRHAPMLDDTRLTGSNASSDRSSRESLLGNHVHCNRVLVQGGQSNRDPELSRQLSNVSSLGAYSIVTQNGVVPVGPRDTHSGYLPKDLFRESAGHTSHGSSIMVYSTLSRKLDGHDTSDDMDGYEARMDAELEPTELEPSGESDSGAHSIPHREETSVLAASEELTPDPEAERKARDIELLMAKFATDASHRDIEAEDDRSLSVRLEAMTDNNNKAEFSLSVPDQGFCDVSSSLEHMEPESVPVTPDRDTDSVHSGLAEPGGGDCSACGALLPRGKVSRARDDHPRPWSDSDPTDIAMEAHRTLIPPSQSYVTHKTMVVT